MTVDETWVHHYEPETKQQSRQWVGPGSPRPKSLRPNNLLSKLWPLYFGMNKELYCWTFYQNVRQWTANIMRICLMNSELLSEKKDAASSQKASSSTRHRQSPLLQGFNGCCAAKWIRGNTAHCLFLTFSTKWLLFIPKLEKSSSWTPDRATKSADLSVFCGFLDPSADLRIDNEICGFFRSFLKKILKSNKNQQNSWFFAGLMILW